MNSYEEYYTRSLYPFQDGVLNIVKKSGAPLYLTGGTALGRKHFGHRFSDDLDLFANASDDFASIVETLFGEFEKNQRPLGYSIDYDRIVKASNYSRFFLRNVSRNPHIVLKIDLVNDVPYHYGELIDDETLGKVDNWRNILSNKIAAVYRFEPKDVADIWIISKNREFSWPDIVHEAKMKEGGTDPVVVHNILRSVPEEELAAVKWASVVDARAVKNDVVAVAEDILSGSDNRLFKK